MNHSEAAANDSEAEANATGAVNATDAETMNESEAACNDSAAKANATGEAESEAKDDDDDKPLSSLRHGSSKTAHDSDDSDDSGDSGNRPNAQTLQECNSPSSRKATTTCPNESAAKEQSTGLRKSARSQKAKNIEPSASDDEDDDPGFPSRLTPMSFALRVANSPWG